MNPPPPEDSTARRELLLLLDGHSLAYRAFFALPAENFATTTGQPTNAVYGFTAMLINVLRDEQPSHIAVAFDRSEPTFRHEQYVEYKANRRETPTDFKGQLSLIFEVLDALGVPRLSLAGYEADDLIATLATQASERGMDVLIVSGDRDVLQLVNDHVTVLMTRRGISDMTRFTPAAVEDKYGLTPAQYPDYAALRGDPSDNLPGIPGVGEKTAAKWVAEFGSLQNLVDKVDQVKGRAGDNLRENLGNVMRNRQLTELTRNVPLDVAPADLVPVPWSRDQIHQLFDTLQFRVLRDRLYTTLPNGIIGQLSAPPPASPEAGFDVALTRVGPGNLADWLASHARTGRIGIAVNGTWGRGTGDVTGLALAKAGSTAATGAEEADGADEATPGPSPAAFIDPVTLTPEDEKALADWLADDSAPKALHDAKGPMHALAARGLQLNGLTSDTALAAYLALPGQRSFDLADLALRYTRRELRGDAAASGQLTLDMAAETEAAEALAQRALATAELADALDADLARRGATKLLADVELPLVSVLAAMERAGIAADVEHFADMSASLGAEVKAAEQGAFAATGHEFNLGSPKQLQEVLFTELKLPKTKRIKTGYTTDSEALTGLLAQTGHPVLEHLLRHRDVAKLKSIVDSLIPMAGQDGRIHTTYNQMIAATGRLSSTDPNLQNIPIRTEEGRRIRQGFIVGKDYECLLTADYSQIELRIMAHLSGDEALAAAFTSGHDFHAATAARVFGVVPEEVTGDLRAKVKVMNYGLAYGLSAYGLSQGLRVTTEEARELMGGYFEQFGGVRDYLRQIVAQARRDGYTETILGRRRYLPDLTSDNRQRREMAERMALNAPIQGSAADIIKVAMLRVDEDLRRSGLRSRMLLQVHDELLFEVAPGELGALRDLVTGAMCGAFSMTVPLEVSMGTGRSWADAAH
ncbi:MAG TPA: DNA polymerase I [Streptosporangiaceae bacterium]|jgi:DNA polymerase-1|nr:DNA polymerase I [Streptosporangiaceae bacterium]